MDSFIFGGNTGIKSPEELARRRALSNAILARNAGNTPKNLWEGLNSAATDILGAVEGNRYDRMEAEGRASGEAAFAPVVEALKAKGRVGNDQLAGVMGNEWLTEPQQNIANILMKQNLEESQPLTPYQRESLGLQRQRLAQDGQMTDYQRAMLDLSQQRLAEANKDPFAERAAAAVQYGLKEGSPEHQSFILTGRMPQEQRSTASDRAAIREADDMAFSSENAIGQLEQALKLNDEAGSGYLASAQAFAARNDPTGFFDDKKGQATTEFSNLVLNQALGSLKAIFGAAPTEGERAILVELQASVDKSPPERKAILDRAVALAQRRLAFNKDRAGELRGGTYYQPGGGPDEAPAETGPKRLKFNPDTGELE